MDDGIAAALFALVLGFPMIVFAALVAGLSSVLAVSAIVASLALAFIAASRISGGARSETEGESTEVDADDAGTGGVTSADSPTELERLHERYARGELTENELEREIDRVLADGDAGGARESTDSRAAGSGDRIGHADVDSPLRDPSDADPELDRE